MVVLLRRSRRSSSAPTVAPHRGVSTFGAAVFDLPTALTYVARGRGVRRRRGICGLRAACYDQEWTSRGPLRRCTILSEPPWALLFTMQLTPSWRADRQRFARSSHEGESCGMMGAETPCLCSA